MNVSFNLILIYIQFLIIGNFGENSLTKLFFKNRDILVEDLKLESINEFAAKVPGNNWTILLSV